MYLKCSTEKHSSAGRPTFFLKTLRKEVKSEDASIIN
jgi:hypothetical protein